MVDKYNSFSSDKEKLAFMKKYKLASKTMTTIPKLWHKLSYDEYKKCELLGYTEEYDTWCSMVINYGIGPVEIHSDFLLDMQVIERHKGKSLKKYTDTFVVFDFETTGINVKSCEIIQIGAIKYKNGVEIATFNEFVRPDNPVPAKITALTGITDLDLCTAEPLEIVLKKFIDFIGDNVLVGYNINTFDTVLLYDNAKYLYDIDITNDFIDLRYISEAYFKKHNLIIENYKLTTIASYFEIDIENAHQALNDCYITYQCYNIFFGVSSPTVQDIGVEINKISNEFEQKLLDLLQDIIISEELPKNCLYLSSNISLKGKNKGKEISKSICVHEPDYPLGSHNVDRIGKNDTFSQIVYEDETIKLKIRDKFLSSLFIPPSAHTTKKKSEGLFTNVIFSMDDSAIYDFIKSVVILGLKYYEPSSSFSCCSQFTKCSDEKKCVHENKLYSKGCNYRMNLEAGRIFYGKNRNID